MQCLKFLSYLVPFFIGTLDILTDILYICYESFYSYNLQLLCFLFQFALFIFSFFIFIYIHYKVESNKILQRYEIILRSFQLAFLTELKLSHFFPVLWDIDEDPDFDFNDNYRMKIVNLQEIFHCIFQSIPQITIQIINNSFLNQWNTLGFISNFFSALFCLKIIYIGWIFKKNKEKDKNSFNGYMELDY